MERARVNQAVARTLSWAERVRSEEVDRASRQLGPLSARERRVIESLSKRIVDGLLSPTASFAMSTSEALPNSRRLPILCRMFELDGRACLASHCVAGRGEVSLEASCAPGGGRR